MSPYSPKEALHPSQPALLTGDHQTSAESWVLPRAAALSTCPSPQSHILIPQDPVTGPPIPKPSSHCSLQAFLCPLNSQLVSTQPDAAFPQDKKRFSFCSPSFGPQIPRLGDSISLGQGSMTRPPCTLTPGLPAQTLTASSSFPALGVTTACCDIHMAGTTSQAS